MINLVDRYYVICTEKDWFESISILIKEKKIKNIETNTYVNDPFIENLLHSIFYNICPGNYCVVDFFTKSLEFKKVLNLSETAKYDYIDLNTEVTYSDFRLKKSNELFNTLKKYKKDLVDPTFGIIKEEYRGISEATPIIAFAGQKGKRTFDAYGRDENYTKSYFTGILESLERYHGAGSKFVKKYKASEIQLKRSKTPFISFYDFCNYEERNYQNENFHFSFYNAEKEIEWTETYSLIHNKKKLIPLQIAYYSSELVDEYSSERYIAESSNGVALGSNWIEASISGILEIIERDSFLVHWYTKSSPQKVMDPENIDDDDIQLLLGYLESINYRVHIFNTTLESRITSFWVLLEYKGTAKDKVHFYTSGAAHFDTYKALYSALVEASTSIKIFNTYKNLNHEEKSIQKLYENFNNVQFLEDHILLYSSLKMKEYLSFAINTKKVTYTKELFKNKEVNIAVSQLDILHELKEIFSCYREEVYLTDLSSGFLKDLGLSCVKVHIPNYQNISFGHMYQNINYDRLKNAILRNNLDGNLDSCSKVPHPFP